MYLIERDKINSIVETQSIKQYKLISLLKKIPVKSDRLSSAFNWNKHIIYRKREFFE